MKSAAYESIMLSPAQVSRHVITRHRMNKHDHEQVRNRFCFKALIWINETRRPLKGGGVEMYRFNLREQASKGDRNSFFCHLYFISCFCFVIYFN